MPCPQSSFQKSTKSMLQSTLLPYAWTEADYLALNTNHLVEFSSGTVEVPPMSTTSHQFLVGCLANSLSEWTTIRHLGVTVVAPLPIRLWRRKYREPDVVFMLKEHADRIGEEYWRGADLVMEVVSGGDEDRRRDLVVKRQEYARAKIAEYWIVDPQEQRITVLRLSGKRYVIHGEFGRGAVATSHLLKGFTADVATALDRGVLPAKRNRTPRRRTAE